MNWSKVKKNKPNNDLLEITDNDLYLDCCGESMALLCNYHDDGLNKKWRAENESGLIYHIRYQVLLLSVGSGGTEYEAEHNGKVLAVSSQKQMLDSNSLISFFAWKINLENVW